jgi:phage-related protein
MSVLLDTSTYKITINSSKTPAYNIKEVTFGDGYNQIGLDGINYDREQWSMDFVLLDTTSSLELETLLLESVNGTSNYLRWTPAGESTQKYWTAHNVSKQPRGNGFWKITCNLRREFPLS